MCVSLHIDSMTSHIFYGGFLFKFTAFTIKIHGQVPSYFIAVSMISFPIAERKEWKTIGYTPVKKALDFDTIAAIANFTDDYYIFAISNRSTAMLKCVSIHTISSIFCPTLKAALARCRFHFRIDYFQIVTQILKKIFPQIMYHNIHNISSFLVLIN
ncbi:hypothetical protein D5272_17045 [bacterium D16-76]|nr:hypothetical protein [bacterium D16-76]